MDRRKNEWKIKYARINAEHECASFSSESLIDAAYDMLCWLCCDSAYDNAHRNMYGNDTAAGNRNDYGWCK